MFKIKLCLCFYLFFICFCFGQTTFSKRINVANKLNTASSFKLYLDSFYIPTMVFENLSPNKYSCSLQKIDINGNPILQKRFKPNSLSYDGGNDLLIRNGKFYISSENDFGLQLQSSLYVFNQKCDTLFTGSYGDTTFYNYGLKILPHLKSKNKLLLFGTTDSTCGSSHSGFDKPIVRIVDTNSVLLQTKIFYPSCSKISLSSADTTGNKGYIFSGGDYNGFITKNYIIKLDSNLNQMWNKNIDTGSSYYNCVTTLKSGKHIFVHNHTDSSKSNSFFWDRITLTKLDENGNIMWRKRYGMPEQYISATKIRELNNGDFIVSGEKYLSSSAININGFLLRTDSVGNLKWWRTYIATTPVKDTIADNYLYDVLQMPDKGFAAVGYATGTSQFGTIQQTWLLRVDSMGCLVPGCSTLSGIEELEKVKNNIVAYPNPFNSELNVSYSFVNGDEDAEIELIETETGRVIEKRILTQKDHKTQFNTKNLSAGVYLIGVQQKNRPSVYFKTINLK